VSAKHCGVEQRAAIMLGISPHSSFHYTYICYLVCHHIHPCWPFYWHTWVGRLLHCCLPALVSEDNPWGQEETGNFAGHMPFLLPNRWSQCCEGRCFVDCGILQFTLSPKSEQIGTAHSLMMHLKSTSDHCFIVTPFYLLYILW